MSEQVAKHTPEPNMVEASPAAKSPETGRRDVAQPLHVRARLVWLFRHDTGDADAHFLRDLVAHFRGFDPW